MAALFPLLRGIKRVLEQSLKHTRFQESSRERREEPIFRAPRVILGDLPPSAAGEQYPFVLVRLLKGELTGEMPREHSVNVGILCGVMTPDGAEKGSEDAFNLADVVLLALAEHRTYAEDWIIELPVSWDYGLVGAMNERSNWMATTDPHYGVAITARFSSDAPIQLNDEGRPWIE